ncbi:MAG: 2-amino-4-hydroxy-6-hydroxymethyldihydropteridine diphosphokinase [Deltaproteobacteria bacterium]|nr:2-amino-4-hydroxy-6-hydroxymethyldihydropteridine diphosphokinase [Deltaproteobacteria bacterium]
MRAIVGMGSNVGDREAHLRVALDAIRSLGSVVAVSDVFETAAVGPPQGPYLNAAIALDTVLEPEALLGALLEIESRLGRAREERWGPRTIDLDLLLFGERTIDLPGLKVPHPRLMERPFARFPAAQVGAPFEPGPQPGARRPFPT